MGNIKQISIKNRTYYFFNDMINIKNFDSTLLKIDKKSYKNIDIYYIRYITIKKSMIMKIFIALILCTWLLVKQVDTSKKVMEINI